MPSPLAAVLLLGGLLQTAADSVTFTVTPGSVSIGESVTVTWAVPEGDRAYLSIAGAVPARGSLSFVPRSSMPVLLTVESARGAEVHAREIIVRGSRGGYPSADDERFQYPLSCDAPRSTNTVALLDRIHGALEQWMRVSPHEYGTRSGSYYFVTMPMRGITSATPSARIVARRTAFVVVVGPRSTTTGTIPCSIRTLIEYRRSGEDTWRVERDERLYTSAAARLRGLIRP